MLSDLYPEFKFFDIVKSDINNNRFKIHDSQLFFAMHYFYLVRQSIGIQHIYRVI